MIPIFEVAMFVLLSLNTGAATPAPSLTKRAAVVASLHAPSRIRYVLRAHARGILVQDGDLRVSAKRTALTRRPTRGSAGLYTRRLPMFNDHDIVVTSLDLERLKPVLDQHDTDEAELLDQELHRARIVDPRSVPADIVTMNSEVVYEDCETLVQRAVRVVYPKDADARRGWVSVLAPIGCALLGLRVGQTITWQLPNGDKRIRVVEIRYQPESNGDYRL
jgi:regulator of nucleoside diphosphate kinase